MTEKQAWLTIAKAYETQANGVNEHDIKINNKNITLDNGICTTIHDLRVEGIISYPVELLMLKKVTECLTSDRDGINSSAYFEYPLGFYNELYPCYNNYNFVLGGSLRSDFCYLMYYMLEYPK